MEVKNPTIDQRAYDFLIAASSRYKHFIDAWLEIVIQSQMLENQNRRKELLNLVNVSSITTEVIETLALLLLLLLSSFNLCFFETFGKSFFLFSSFLATSIADERNMSQSAADDEVSARPKLSLQKRSDAADSGPSPKSSKPNPFGEARPREQVIAEREGKNELEVLKEQASKEWKPQTVLTETQLEEKKAAEAELLFAKTELEKETDSEKIAFLTEEVATKERNLEQLLASFEKLAVAAHATQTGVPKRSYDKNPPPPPAYGTAYSGDSNLGDFRNRVGRDGNDRSGFSYGDTWGGVKKTGRQSECYACGELGHFARECPRGGSSGGDGFGGGGNFGGSFGGGKGGGRACYTCGQTGHFSRDCPQGGSFNGNSGSSYYGGYKGANEYTSNAAVDYSGYGRKDHLSQGRR